MVGTSRHLSWSITRSKLLAECPRLYFYEYFADGEPESYDAWNLKELVTLPMLAGDVVDLVITSALKRVAKGEPLPTGLGPVGARNLQKFIDRSPVIVQAMRERARTAASRRASSYKPLVSDWYGLDYGKEYEEKLTSQVESCLSSFEKSEVLQRVVSVDPTAWGPFTRSLKVRPFFEAENDIRAYTSFDFYFEEGGLLYILDWKTGRQSIATLEHADRQLAAYAIYGARNLSFPMDRIRIQAVWLDGPARWKPLQVSREQIDKVESSIKYEVAEEAAKLAIVEYGEEKLYLADRRDFPANPSVKRCTQCKFRQICIEGRESCRHLDSTTLAGPASSKVKY